MGIKYAGMEFTDAKELKAAIAEGAIHDPKAMQKEFHQKHDVTDASPSMQVPHGLFHDQNTGGLFTRPGSTGDMYHTIVQPDGSGFVNNLYIGLNDMIYPEYDVLSGQHDAQGSAADDFCSPGPNAGEVKLATFRQPYGKALIETEQGSLIQMGGNLNSADSQRRLLHSAAVSGPFTPAPAAGNLDLNTETGLTFFRLGTEVMRQFHSILFTGTQGTNGGAGSIWIEEFDGFDNLIVANPTDVRGNTIAAASSIVEDWASADVGGTVGGSDIVELISALMHHVNRTGAQTNLPYGGVIVTHPDLFYMLTKVWSCGYLTDRCSTLVDSAAGERLNADAAQTTRMRDEMRSGSFLWINGQPIPVVQISSVARAASGGGMNSPIYYIPLSALGSKVTYIEAFNQGNARIRNFANVGDADYRILNGGLYAATKRQTGFCIEYIFAVQPRLVMRTPWLAWRIENVNYTFPGQHYSRDWNPAGEYWRDGGQYYNAFGTSLPSYSDS